MIVVSAYTRAGTIVSDVRDSTAFVRTLENRWGLEPLTERDRRAGDLSMAFNLETAREVDAWPELTPIPVPEEDNSEQDLTPIGMEKMRLFAAAAALSVTDETVDLRTVGAAMTFLKERIGRLL
jgi:phospholipase C